MASDNRNSDGAFEVGAWQKRLYNPGAPLTNGLLAPRFYWFAIAK